MKTSDASLSILPWTFDLELPTEADTEAFAKILADSIHAPMTITLSGEIGAGKTSLMRALLRTLGVTSRIKSPSYSLVESYELAHEHIHHFDFYRLQDDSELEALGFREYFQANAICCIEWPERVNLSSLPVDLSLFLTVQGQGRGLSIHSAKPLLGIHQR